MSLETIFQDITQERARQELVHPEIPVFLLHPNCDPQRVQIQESLRRLQQENDTMESSGQHSWYGIAYEELKEVFSAVTVEELYKEAIQAASVYIRLAQAVKGGEVAI